LYITKKLQNLTADYCYLLQTKATSKNWWWWWYSTQTVQSKMQVAVCRTSTIAFSTNLDDMFYVRYKHSLQYADRKSADKSHQW